MAVTFAWDEEKNRANQEKHGVSFEEAQYAFADPNRGMGVVESRYFCLGRVEDGILTVRFTYRGNVIRIFGAGYWRKGRNRYEEEQRG